MTQQLPPVVYIAGPFRGPTPWAVEQNIRAAETLALEVWRAGAAALCPHTNTRFFDGAAPDELFLVGDLAMLSKCDALLMMPNWRASTGARAECEFALSRGIPTFYSLDALMVWMQKEWTVAEVRP